MFSTCVSVRLHALAAAEQLVAHAHPRISMSRMAAMAARLDAVELLEQPSASVLNDTDPSEHDRRVLQETKRAAAAVRAAIMKLCT